MTLWYASINQFPVGGGSFEGGGGIDEPDESLEEDDMVVCWDMLARDAGFPTRSGSRLPSGLSPRVSSYTARCKASMYCSCGGNSTRCRVLSNRLKSLFKVHSKKDIVTEWAYNTSIQSPCSLK